VDTKSGVLAVMDKPRFQYIERVAWMPRGEGLLAIGQQEESSFQQAWYVPSRGGEPKKIGNDLNDYFGVSISSDATSLVSVQVQTLSSVYVLPPDGRIRQLTPGSGRYFDLAWTPDGRLVYASDASGQADIWIMNGDGSDQRVLTSGKGRSYSPSVSPDGKTIAFHSNLNGNWNIWRMDLDGRNVAPLTHDNRDSNWPQWTPDGQYVIFHHTEPNALFNIYRIPAAGGEPERLTSELTTRPAVGPDGRIACWYSEQVGTPSWKLAVLPPGGGSPIRVFDLPPAAIPETPLRWTPSGDGIAYIGSRDGVRNIYFQPVDGKPAERLTNFNSGQIYSIDWSRNGKLAYSRGMSSSDVVLIRDLKR
jgi:Tol biopolymer transport system component